MLYYSPPSLTLGTNFQSRAGFKTKRSPITDAPVRKFRFDHPVIAVRTATIRSEAPKPLRSAESKAKMMDLTGARRL